MRKGNLDRIKDLLFGENIRTKLTEAQAVSLLKLAISHRRTNALYVLLGLGEDVLQYSKQPDEWPWVFRSTLPSHGVSLLLQAFDEYKMADSEISKTVIALATATDQQLAGQDGSFDSRALVNCRLPHGRRFRAGSPLRWAFSWWASKRDKATDAFPNWNFYPHTAIALISYGADTTENAGYYDEPIIHDQLFHFSWTFTHSWTTGNEWDADYERFFKAWWDADFEFCSRHDLMDAFYARWTAVYENAVKALMPRHLVYWEARSKYLRLALRHGGGRFLAGRYYCNIGKYMGWRLLAAGDFLARHGVTLDEEVKNLLDQCRKRGGD